MAGRNRKMSLDRWRELLRYLLRRYSESRRALIFSVLLALLFLYYLAPWFWRGSANRYLATDDGTTGCLAERVSRYDIDISHLDASIHYPSTTGDPEFLPYVGNGFLAHSPSGADKEIYLAGPVAKAIGLKVAYFPTVITSIDALSSEEAIVTHWKDGVVIKIQCYHIGGCVCVETSIYAHRTRPSILAQDVRFFNPTSKHVTFQLQQTLASGWDKATTRKTKSATRTETEISVTTGVIQLSTDVNAPLTPQGDPKNNQVDECILVTVASTTAPQSVDIGPGKTTRLHILTGVVSTPKAAHEKEVLKEKNKVESSALSVIDETLNIAPNKLKEDHIQVWNNLWKTGFSISSSKAAGAINGDRVNATIYYVVSNVRSPFYEESEGLTTKRFNLEKLLYFPDRCYSGHHTLQASRLWPVVSSEAGVARLARLWYLTLEKQGCGTMLKAGADGIIEAIILSIGSLKFTNDHVEFGMEPKDLHRDFMSFRRISYGNATHLNITVIVGEDNKAQIYAALDRSDRSYYACDGGCLDPPVKLTNALQPFPVKQTEPKTAVLYITSDKQHMEDLKHAIHVHEVDVAPPHEHHVLALHRHGHHLGGLPPFFWAAVAFLIVVFHLFLVKLVCNECKFSKDRYSSTNNRRFQM